MLWLVAALSCRRERLNLQVPDGLAAADDIRLEGEGEIVLGFRYFVGDLALGDTINSCNPCERGLLYVSVDA